MGSSRAIRWRFLTLCWFCVCACVLWELGLTYKGLNSFEWLPGFKGPAKGYSPRLGLKIQEDPKGVPSQHMMKILNLRNFTKWKVLKTRYLPFCKIIALGRAQKSRKTHKGLLSPRWWTFLISGILWNGRYLKIGTFHFVRFLKWSSSHSVLGGALNYIAEV